MDEFPIMKLDESEFPYKLLDIPQPPKQLYLRGVLPETDKKFLTIVGTRRCSPYGQDVCELLVRSLATYPVVIVSGLAMGIDGIAHRAAIDSGITAMAFPGSGLDEHVITPRYNYALAQAILQSGGSLVSEFDPEFSGTIWSFPQRNRLMAGIADVVLVIEAENKSGTRITAKLATDYNRDVLAVPGNITSPSSEGTNQLIREGATPITGPHDLLEALGFSPTEKINEALYEACSPDEKHVIDMLASPRSRGDLIRELGISTHEAQVLLASMEIKGLIKESFGELRRA